MVVCRGIVIVTAHVRGGGELGREWHAAATVHRKWSTLYDYASTLRYLFDSNITAPGLVALEGFSAGMRIQFFVSRPSALNVKRYWHVTEVVNMLLLRYVYDYRCSASSTRSKQGTRGSGSCTAAATVCHPFEHYVGPYSPADSV